MEDFPIFITGFQTGDFFGSRDRNLGAGFGCSEAINVTWMSYVCHRAEQYVPYIQKQNTRKLKPYPFFLIFFWFFSESGLMGWIWIGFALLNILYKCQIHRFVDLWWKTTSWSELLFLQNRGLFSNSIFSLISAKPLYQKVRIDHRITLTFKRSW